MSALRVRVIDQDVGSTAEHTFSRSPVRVGRGELNDLQLDRPYVSNWHGLIHYDADGIRYVDLGSTNGTMLDGVRLARNAPAPISGAQQLAIGRLKMELSLGADDEKPRPRRQMTNFALRIPRPGEAEPGSPASVEAVPVPRVARLPAAPAPARQPAASPPIVPAQSPQTAPRPAAPIPPRSAQATPGTPAAPVSPIARSHPVEPAERLAPPATTAVSFPLATTPPPAATPPLATIPPSAVATPPGPAAPSPVTTTPPPAPLPAPTATAPTGEAQLDGEALGLLRSFAEAYLPPDAVPTDASGVRRFLEALAEVLETALRGYLELRNGHEQFGAEMGVRVPRGDGAIGRIGEAGQLLGWLLEPTEGESRPQQLASAFADLMIHQVALLNGVRAGAQALLVELSATEIAARENGRVSGGLQRFWPLRELALLRAIEARHREFAEEESAIVDVLFGKDFARAYASLMGRRSGGDGEATPSRRRRTGPPRS